MTTATDITETIQDGIVKTVETGQRLTLEALSAAVSTFEGVLPKRPVPPFTSALAPKETVESGFRLAERLLESQKAFVGELVKIAYPEQPASAKRPSAS